MESGYRTDFPTLTASEDTGKDSGSDRSIAYLDNAATTQKPSSVLRATDYYYRHCNANPYRGVYQRCRTSTKLYEAARHVVADFIGADQEEIVFTRNTTEALNIVAYCYALDRLGPGDEIALPRSEHHSNLVPWQFVCKKTGATLTFLELDGNGRLAPGEVERKIRPATKIVAIAQASNVLGTVFPLPAVIARARDVGAVTVLDCAQSVAHRQLDVHALGADFAAFSGHKMYAPMGIGVLYARRSLLETMTPFLYGGEMIDQVQGRESTFETGPKRFEAGTPNVAGAIGLAAAIDYVQNIGFETIRRIEHALTVRLLDGMRSLKTVTLYGNPLPDDDRSTVVSFNVRGADPQDVAFMLDERHIEVRSGAHCAQPLHRSLGIETSCRVSPCFYNTPREIDRFLEGIEGVRHNITRHVVSMFP